MLLFSFTVCAQGAASIIEMTPYEVTEQDEQIFEDLGLPDAFNCKIETCPEKFKASGMNLFSLSGKSIKMRPKHLNKLKSDSSLYGIIQGNTLAIYKKGKGLIKSGLKILR